MGDVVVNLILDDRKNLVRAFSGHPIKAFEKAVDFVRHYVQIPISEVADVVISCPGYPKGQNLYQATRAANTIVLGPTPVVRRGGLILIPARCEDGVGDQNFVDFMSRFSHFAEFKTYVEKHGFGIGEHKAYVLKRILEHASVAMTDCEIDEKILRSIFLGKYETVQDAVNSILNGNPKARFLVVKNGVNVIPILRR